MAIKRNSSNIGKRVKVQLKGKGFYADLWNGSVGTVKGFRGDRCAGDPWVSVFMDRTGSIFPFPGSCLEVISNR